MATTNRDEKMKEITDRLQAGLEELFSSEKYAEYLRVMSQFHHYSFNNTLLIAMQKPDATLVAGYHAWEKKFNRHVMKGEKGIQIIAPAPFKEKQEHEKVDPETGEVMLREDGQPETEEVMVVIPRFKVSTVFDLSQTDGDPLPELGPGELTASVENYELFMNAIRSVAPVPIRFEEIHSGAKGYYDNANKEIVIQNGMSEMQTMKTAVHETAHAILHDRDIMQEQGIQKDQMTKEVEAESVAFVSLAHFELDTSDYSFPYIAGWSSGRDAKELKASLDTIRKTSSEIIDGIEASMREQILERQKNEPIRDDSVDIIVDGHEGTWRTVLSQEINGEMFYLMESQEYGDSVANILLRANRDLVAEDLWNGINYSATEAVKEYFNQNQIAYSPADFPLKERYSIDTQVEGFDKPVYFIVDNVTGGPLGEKGDVTLYEDRKFLLEQVRTMNQERPPIYFESEVYARDHNQVDAYRFSMQENIACKEGIERVIRENFDGMHLNQNVIQPVIARFGAERVAYVLANTLQLESWDGRYSRTNQEWASAVIKNSEQSILNEILALPISSLPQNYLNVTLEDDRNSPYGGTDHSNETFGEFLESAELPEEASIGDAHLSLQECGIKSPFESVEYLYENTLRSAQRNEIEDRINSLREGRRSFFISSHPAVLDGFTDYFRKEMNARGLELDGSKLKEKPFIDHFYVVEDLEVHGQLAIREYPSCEEALAAYFALPNNKLKALGIQNTNPLPGSLDFIHCVNGIDTAIMDYTFVEVWNNPEIQEVQEEIENALALHDTELAYDLSDGFMTVGSVESGYEYHFYDLNYDCEASGIIETAVDGEPVKSLEGAVREIGEKLGISFDDWLVTDYQKLIDRIHEHEEASLQEAMQEGTAISAEVPDELAVGYDAGFITVQRTDNGYDYAIFNLKCRPIDCGVLENPDLSIHEAMAEILNDEGLDEYNTWETSYKTIMAEAGETEIVETPSEPAISFFVAENIEFPVMGEYHEADSLSEAIKLYEDNPEGNLNGIGISLDEGSLPLVQREEGMTKMTDLVSDNPIVQKAFEEAKQHFQEGSVTEYHPREAQEHEPVVDQRTVEHTPATPVSAQEQTEKQEMPVDKTGSRKDSILKALRERQAQIKEREKQPLEQKNRERKKGEQTL